MKTDMILRQARSRTLWPAGLIACIAMTAGFLPVTAETDFGDHRSTTLVGKAWDAMNRGDLDGALTYADKCIAMYEAEAISMQASLSGFPASEPKEETFRYWALNDVGTSYFIRGEILMKRGDTKGAKAAYETCAEKFSYAQCWDPKGWFWKPAESAKQKAVELQFDTDWSSP